MFKHVYVMGPIEGQVLKLEAPLSFWGGFDPQTGKIIDQSHPQRGLGIKGRVLALPYAKGSAGTPAAIAEAVRCGHGPRAVLVRDPDANLAAGLRVAEFLYGIRVPGGQVTRAAYDGLATGQRLGS